ncbi:glycoside hydrolase [Cristinia sonorae]|uniref:alpha-1,2-Mannosidase n=1 Tax=Cristinia sonorae TaxID=1940300 RepID=A0A8K0XSN2_9AGAR|nr:glycoside hydrolase [Cristinia sonorae]
MMETYRKILRRRSRLLKLPLLAAFTVISCVYYGVSHRWLSRDEQHTFVLPIRLPSIPSHERGSEQQRLWASRTEEVKEGFLHAYSGYKRFAYGHDELRPLTNRGSDKFNGWGLSLVDGLDTMWLMGLHDEFNATLSVIDSMNFSLDATSHAPFFETVIRYLGGLLSAYALSKETVLLQRADELGQKLLPAFNTSLGLPAYGVNTVTGALSYGWLTDAAMLAEVASCQMEYKYLAHLTGRVEYYEKVEKVMDVIKRAKLRGGMFPTRLSMHSGTPMNYQFSVGGFADSAHEYMLKQWLLSSRTEPKSLNLYLRSVSAIIQNLLYLSPSRHLLYVTDVDTYRSPATPSRKFEHLSCFLPGLLALGAQTLPPSALSQQDKELHLWAAEGLANTCWVLYRDHVSGLGPDEVEFHDTNFKFGFVDPEGDESVGYVPETRRNRLGLKQGKWVDHVKEWDRAGRPGGGPPGVKDPKPMVDGLKDYANTRHEYLLRPETIEAIYLMWRTTGDLKWRERGWEIYQAIDLRTRTPTGFASLRTVVQVPSPRLDEMPSYFLAETLKYMYLLFHEDDLIPLDKWVFNTEAHPFPMFEWTSWEKKKYHIPA